mgnify:CR=1 FL=1
MAAKEFRQFIEALEKTGDVLRISQEVDWDLEVGAIGRRAYERGDPAILFEKIKDYPEGYRIFNGSLGTFRRVAISMGLPPDTSIRDIYKEYERRESQPVKPMVVPSGPCKENILQGDDVDLYRLPAPMIHEGDGGRYIGTWDVVVFQDPASEWANWGMYRFMVHNQRYMVGFPRRHSHLGMILHQKFVPEGKPMPIALVLGADPMCHQVATASYGIGVSEADYAGALRQAPVELVKCETSDLLVPAQSEIVIEGEILPDMTAQEGPFGEYPGYRTEGARMGVLCRVKAITFRNSPILSMISLGTPPDDNSIATPIASAIAVKRRLRKRDIPVTDVYSPPAAVLHIAVIGVKSGGRKVAESILDALTERRADWSKVIMVDEDVDVFDMDQVMHALATKCHPDRGIIHREVEAGKANPLTPHYTPEERRAYKGAMALFDCTWPPEWPKETRIPIKTSFDSIYPKELQDMVVKNWKEYGFSEGGER